MAADPLPAVIGNAEAAEWAHPEGCHVTEWSNSPRDEAASIARARVDPGVRTRLHRLDGITERYLILSGAGRVEVGDLAQDVGPDDVVIIPPGTPQRITNTGETDLVFLAICTPRFRQERYRDLQAG